MEKQPVRTEEQELELDAVMSVFETNYTRPPKAPIDKRSEKEKDLDEIMYHLK